VPGNLPAPLSSFVGREIEKVEVGRDLSMTRLLTLTGAGGSGKTRLALEVARGLAGLYPDGVWLVELAPLSDPELAQGAVAQALGVREQPGQLLARTLAAHLRSRHTLLVIDNCEHMVEEAASLVNQLLKACPRLRVLATSREPLGVQGESVRPVPPLALPAEVEEGEPTVEGLMLSEAVRLFVERARSRLPEFEVTQENAPSVARACRKLDGIPLAIELAAARMGSLALEQVAQRLDVSLGLLTGGGRTVESRHRTLRATLDWSHQLLSEPEKVLFGRLSVFAGGWTLEGAEAVCKGDGIERGGVIDLLDRMVDKSLVVAEAGASRYRMLEPIKQYAAEKLEDEGGTAEQVRRRHAVYYAAFAETAEPELLGPDQVRWVRRLGSELANLRAAISWSLVESGDEARAELGLRLAAALWRFWDMEGFQERERWLVSGLDKGSGTSPAVRAKALLGLGWTLLFKRDYGRAIPALEEAVALYKGLGDDSGTAFALANLGYAVQHGGFRERVRAFVEEGEPLAHRDLEGHTRAYLRTMLGCAAMAEGDPDSAISQLEEGLAMSRELGDPRGALMALLIMGMAEYERGGAERGAAALEEGVRIALELGDRVASVYQVWAMGKVHALRGKPLRAAKLWGAAEAHREHMGWSLSYLDLTASDYERDLGAARASLDETAFDAAWAEGRTMSPDRALQYALSAEEPIPTREPPRTHADERTSPLTRREIEVARLAAQGLTNRQIAAALSISEHTAANHVRKILGKLGLRSRTQITPQSL
jgi:predicted ATPase/DNA-binding CsgD family transcriptional regulator